MNKKIFYLLSFTWGLILTLIGLLVAGALLIAGKRPKRWGYCWHFQVGENWGGLNLGIILLTDKTPSIYTRNHEHGHAIQNCYFGPFMPIVVTLPSAIRYWYRTIREKKGLPNKGTYDDIWFEHRATVLGNNLYYDGKFFN